MIYKQPSIYGRSTHSRLLAICLAILGLSIVVPSQGFASQSGDTRKVTFHGILKRKPCLISNDGDIYVHFEKIGINKVDGQRYLHDLPYTISCEETDPSLTLKMTIKGTPSGFEDTALETNATGLGIRILKDGQPMKINDAVTINYTSQPKIQVVPVKQTGVDLQEQDFSTTATMLAEYE